jgi:hypothetical protein
MKYRNYIPKTAGPLKSSHRSRDTGITPGELRGNHILLAEGHVVSPVYEGSVQVSIDADFHGLLDLQVWHDDLPDFDPAGQQLVHDPEFGREVVRVLQEAGKLPPGDEFELRGAERGMQRPYRAIFESLERAGHNVGRAAALVWGAADQEFAEEQERFFSRGPIEWRTDWPEVPQHDGEGRRLGPSSQV